MEVLVEPLWRESTEMTQARTELVESPQKTSIELHEGSAEVVLESSGKNSNEISKEGYKLVASLRKTSREFEKGDLEVVELSGTGCSEIGQDGNLLIWSSSETSRKVKEGNMEAVVEVSSNCCSEINKEANKLAGSSQKISRENVPIDPLSNAVCAITDGSLDSVERFASQIPIEQSMQEDARQGPVNNLRKMKWKERARSKSPNAAPSGTEDTPSTTFAAGKTHRSRRSRKGLRALEPRPLLPRPPIRTPSVPNETIRSPRSPTVLQSPQTPLSTSVLTAIPPISPQHMQPPLTPVPAGSLNQPEVSRSSVLPIGFGGGSESQPVLLPVAVPEQVSSSSVMASYFGSGPMSQPVLPSGPAVKQAPSSSVLASSFGSGTGRQQVLASPPVPEQTSSSAVMASTFGSGTRSQLVPVPEQASSSSGMAFNFGSGTGNQPVLPSGPVHESRSGLVCGTSDHPLNPVLHIQPTSAADNATNQASHVVCEEGFSFHVPASVALSPSTKPGRHFASNSGKPPRPPERLPLYPLVTRSPGYKRILPQSFADPLLMQPTSKRRRKISRTVADSATLANRTILRRLRPRVQPLPHSLQTQPPQRIFLAGVFQPVPSGIQPLLASPVPWLVPPGHAGLRNGLPRWINGPAITIAEKQNQHRRTLQGLQTDLSKKLKIWGLKSHLLQEINRHEGENNDKIRLVISEEQRESFVKNMVQSCRKDPQMRATFLDSVKQLADLGVLQTSACHLVAQGPCDSSQELLKAWKGMIEHPQEKTATIDLYKSVDKLHRQGDTARQKLPWPREASICSLGKNPDGAWEVVIPTLDSQKKGSQT